MFGKGMELNVRPNTEGSSGPSVYLLKSSQLERMCSSSVCPRSVCLATDFPTPENDTKAVVNKNEVNLKDRFMLDKSGDKIWRYSTVLWDINHVGEDLYCKIIYKSKDITSEDIKRDEKFNTLLFTVFGLRFLTIKGIIFNLISTYRIWLT
ncbi:T cell receptor alpha chain MC.7.G5-like [Xenopus laevis]|uniref:Immunoglobulin C1-set domain-containing protein n=1 Tax=Xenopus laevis TaxID=8355 RepID=A0A974E2Q1_XENLA|nr:T cell receptor alpha chain MC.7.G5-like [Xenopus laevis]OCU01482.1 hypothetical protein XELAEV_18007273mg [Xenopus laevis]